MKKSIAVILAVSLLILSVPAAFADGSGFFGILAREEDSDERLPVLEEVAEEVSVTLVTGCGIPVEIGQAYCEGNRVFVSYRIGASTDLIELFEGAPEDGIEWDVTEENWIPAEIPAWYPDTQKENGWLDGKGQRWLKSPYCSVLDGLDMEDGSYADIYAGFESRQADGSVIGWKECFIPEGKEADALTFRLGVSGAVAVKFQDSSTFKENFGKPEREYLSFTVIRNNSLRRLQGVSPAEPGRARAELAAGNIDITGAVCLAAPDQAASWLAWQDGEEDESGTDIILCWNLYRDGELVSADLDGSVDVSETGDELLFGLMFPRMEDLTGLSLVPEYAGSGEHPEEAIPLEAAD